MAAKKVLVIGLMAVLLLSVLVSAISFYTRSPAPSPPINQAEANDKINRILDICIRSLPNGIPACDDPRLRDGIHKVCESNNNKLDACHDGKMDQYYRIRNEAKNTINNNNSSNKQ
jgi:hypothetical protein